MVRPTTARLVDVNLESDFGAYGEDSPIVFEVPLKEAKKKLLSSKMLTDEEKNFFVNELEENKGEPFIAFLEDFRLEVGNRTFA